MEPNVMDIVMKTLITAGVMKYLRNYLETSVRLPRWDNILKYAWVGALILTGLATVFSINLLNDNFYYLLLFVVAYIIYQSREFRSARLLMVAVSPMLIFVVLNNIFKYITPNFYQSYRAFFSLSENFAILWIIGFGIYAQKQNKQEKLQKIKDDQEKRLLEAQKNELEFLVSERTAEIMKQKEELESTLVKLKATQDQLIQSEKLASLGELTAGIAHEIQNPLNFVNNFAELSVELVKELNDEIGKVPLDKDLIENLMHDLTQNQEKINHHGKRASSIVKGMLEHSRKSTGVKEPTDMNALADEYLRLSYHGLRAKEKDFNATMETHFETPLSKVEVIPQDMGRVLLNLINNAFFAVSQKAKALQATSAEQANHDGEPYEPTVTVSTRYWAPPLGQKGAGGVEIRVKDNGIGMPDSVKAKVFQPFFTTKPTGQGTGLGLSISYDIVTKGHGGTLEVDTKEGEYTEFIIKLP